MKPLGIYIETMPKHMNAMNLKKDMERSMVTMSTEQLLEKYIENVMGIPTKVGDIQLEMKAINMLDA